MSASYELQLMALAIALYVFESFLFLDSNEGVLVASSKGKWQASLGSEDFTLLGRSVYITALLAPHRATFRLGWSPDGTGIQSGSTEWSDLPRKLASVAPFTIAAGVALYVLLPLGLFTRLGKPLVACAVVATYLNTVIALWLLYTHREVAQISGRRFAALAFECLACPPFAVTLVRRVALAQIIDEPLPVAGRRLLDSEGWNEMRAKCVDRIDYEIRGEPEDSHRTQALRTQREVLHSSEGRK